MILCKIDQGGGQITNGDEVKLLSAGRPGDSLNVWDREWRDTSSLARVAALDRLGLRAGAWHFCRCTVVSQGVIPVTGILTVRRKAKGRRNAHCGPGPASFRADVMTDSAGRFSLGVKSAGSYSIRDSCREICRVWCGKALARCSKSVERSPDRPAGIEDSRYFTRHGRISPGGGRNADIRSAVTLRRSDCRAPVSHGGRTG